MPKYEIPNLANACRLLKLLASERGGLTLKVVAERLNIPRTSALRIVSTLCEAHLLEKAGNEFCLGPGLIPLGTRALEGLDLRAVAQPVVQEVARETGETTHVAILSGDRSLLIEVAQSASPIRVGSPAGTAVELHCSATGKIFLTYCLSDRIEEFYGATPAPRRTKRTFTTAEDLRTEIARTLLRGYAIDNEEFFEGVRCLAVPVRDATGGVVAALGITGAANRVSEDAMPDLAQRLMEGAAQISKSLGYVAYQRV